MNVMKRIHCVIGKHQAAKSTRQRILGLRRREEGNSLIEVAFISPLLVLLVCYAINYGYYFIVAINLTAAARSASEYSIQGFSAPGAGSLPAVGTSTTVKSVVALAMGDLGNLMRSSTTSSVEVCSASANTVSTNTVQCASYGPTSLSFTADTDPESGLFQLNRIDIVYTINPPVPLTFFHTSWTPPATFHRSVEMRAIN